MDKKNRKKIIIPIITVLIALSVIGLIFVQKQKNVYAKHTLPGIETIAANNGYYDPYIILEVVKDKADASLGYLIGGEEPIKDGKSIKDFSTQEERLADFPTVVSDMVPDKYDNLDDDLNDEAFSSGLFVHTGSRSVDIKGEYISATNKIEDASWIQPGKVAWDWWNANNIYGVDFEAGINTETYKYYIDFAATYGIENILLDEGWYTLGDLSAVVPEIDMEEIISF